MRRYDIVFGILLILSIIDFALAAPVPVQEKREARVVDVVHILKDVTSILGKRGNEEVERLLAEFFDAMGKPVDSPDTHTSSISPPPEPEHGPESSEHDVKAPTPNPTLSQANPELSMEPLNPSSISYFIPGEKGEEPTESDIEFMYEDEVDTSSSESSGPIASPTSTSDHELTGPHVPQPNPNKRPSTGSDSDFDWDHWIDVVNPPRPKRPKLASSEEFGQAHENQLVPQPDSLAGPSTHFDMTDLFGPDVHDLPLSPATPALPSSKEFNQAHVEQVVHVPQPNSPPLDPGASNRGPSDPRLQTEPGNRVAVAATTGWPNSRPLDPGTLNRGPSDTRFQTEPGDMVATTGWPDLPMPNNLALDVLQGPRPSPESTDPELHLDHQSLSTEIKPEDLPAAVYAAKGKGKEVVESGDSGAPAGAQHRSEARSRL